MPRPLLALALAAALAGPAAAQTYTWTGAVNANWNTTTANWSGAGTTWVNGSGSNAVFDAAGIARPSVTTAVRVTAHSLTFNANGYIVAAASPAGRTLALSGAGAYVEVAGGVSARIGLILSGTAGLDKRGGGTLVLGSTTSTGGITVTGGTLQLGRANILSNTGPLTLAGGTLSTGATARFSDTVGPLALTADSTIALGTGAHNLQFNGVGPAPVGTLAVTGWTGQTSSGRLQFQLAGVASASAANALYADFLGRVDFGGGFAPGGVFVDTPSTAVFELVPTPEPGAVLGVAAAGLGLAGWVRRRRAG